MAESPDSSWTLWIDGTAWPNPGKIGLGIVLRSPDGNARCLSIPLGTSGCNNEAELQALAHGLSTARSVGANTLRVVSDSDFVVRHSLGDIRTRTARLQRLVDEIRHAMTAFTEIRLEWVPRHRNQEADRLARSALGLAAKPAAPAGRRKK